MRRLAMPMSIADRFLIQQKKYEDALAEINKGIGLGVAFLHIGYYNRGVAEELLGRYRDAYYDYMRTLELEPSFAAAQARLKLFRVIRPGDMANSPPP